jgi:hypothetical protein
MAYLVSDLKTDIALRIHDANMSEVSTIQLLNFINMAVRDMRNAGWLIPIAEDVSLVEAVNTWTFAVPSGFVYLHTLLRQNVATGTYDFEFPRNYWRIDLIGTTPTIAFDEREYLPDPGAKIMVQGQARPALYTADANTIDNMVDSFLRERATYYSASFVAGGLSQYAQYRQKLADTAFAISEQQLARSPQEFRQWPDSVKVPGR